MPRVGSGTGQGGKSIQDRKLAARVRRLALREIEVILKNRTSPLYPQVIVKLAGSVLPRLNEHTGEDGEKLFPQPIYSGLSTKGDAISQREKTQ